MSHCQTMSCQFDNPRLNPSVWTIPSVSLGLAIIHRKSQIQLHTQEVLTALKLRTEEILGFTLTNSKQLDIRPVLCPLFFSLPFIPHK